jgi:hypothetical protein
MMPYASDADRPDQLLIALAPHREHQKYFPTAAGLPHGAKAAFHLRIRRAGNDGKRSGKQAFNQRNGLGAQMYRQM